MGKVMGYTSWYDTITEYHYVGTREVAFDRAVALMVDIITDKPGLIRWAWITYNQN